MLPKETSVRQLKKLRAETKGKDIGDLTVNDRLNKNIPNIQYIGNPIDMGIESWEEFSKKDSQLQTIAYKSKLVNKPLVKENKKLNENIFTNKIEDLYNKLKKDPNTKNAKSINIVYDGLNAVQIEFEDTHISRFKYLEKDEIVKKLKEELFYHKRNFNKYTDFCDTGLRGISKTFSKNCPYVRVEASASLRISIPVKRNDGNGTMRANYDNMIFDFDDKIYNNLNISETDYINKYGDEGLNIAHFYILLIMEDANKTIENKNIDIKNNEIIKFDNFNEKVKLENDKKTKTRIHEGPEKGNNKIVTSERPKAMPAPQKSKSKIETIKEFLNIQDEKMELINLIKDISDDYNINDLENMGYDELQDIYDNLVYAEKEEESSHDTIQSFESFKLYEPKSKTEKQPEYTMLGQEKEIESNPNFGVAATKDKEIKKIAWFNNFTNDTKVDRERQILNAGQYVDNDKVKGQINKIDGKDVYVELSDEPMTIKKFNIKDVVKTKKEEK